MMLTPRGSCLALCVLVGLGLTSCSGSADSCASNADCTPGQACLDGACVAKSVSSGTACNTDDDCGTGELCGLEQMCTPRENSGTWCASSAECGENQMCSSESMTCVSLPPGFCKHGDQCGASASKCTAPTNGVGRCVECLAATDCALDGATCNVRGVCQGGTVPSTSSSAEFAPSSSSYVPPEPSSYAPPESSSSSAARSSSSSAGRSSSSSGHSSSSSTSVTTGEMGGTVDMAGWVLRDTDSARQFTIPQGTRVPAGGLLIIARDATKAAFEAEWQTTLRSSVVFINAQVARSGVPLINGGETWELVAPDGTVMDGPTFSGVTGKSYERFYADTASDLTNWESHVDSDATPGFTQLWDNDYGVVISEWSDDSAAGKYPFEFVEIYVNP